MPFRPYEEVAGDPAIELPFRGTTYRILPPNAAVAFGLAARVGAAAALEAGIDLSEEAAALAFVSDDEELDLAQQVLGDAYERMLADLSWDEFMAAVFTCLIGWTKGKDAAEAFWELQGKGIAAKGSKKPKGRRTATPTPSAAASTTPSSASPSGTTRRKARAAAGKASRSQSSSGRTRT